MGVLYLLPNLLGDDLPDTDLPPRVKEAVITLDGLIAESEKGARRFLRRFLSHDQMASLPLKLLNEHSKPSDLSSLLEPILAGQKWGLVSDAGLPCIADPGAPLVLMARKKNVDIVAIPGPSSLILALQLSGLNGQRFSFHGYLPREIPLLQAKLRLMEKISRQDDATQIWIEAPYRSAKIFQTALEILDPETYFCVGLSISCSSQRVHTFKIYEWRKQSFQIEKEPAVFLLYPT